jgi:hypothetical protein
VRGGRAHRRFRPVNGSAERAESITRQPSAAKTLAVVKSIPRLDR